MEPTRDRRPSPNTDQRVMHVIPSSGTAALVRERIDPDDASVLLVWRETVPTELRASVAPYARWLCRYGPRWVERVIVCWDAHADSNAVFSVQCDRSYNRVFLNLAPGWLDTDIVSRNMDIAHELVHVYAAPVNALIVQMRGREWLVDGTLRDVRNAQYEQADEQFTVDMARLLVRHLPPAVAVAVQLPVP